MKYFKFFVLLLILSFFKVNASSYLCEYDYNYNHAESNYELYVQINRDYDHPSTHSKYSLQSCSGKLGLYYDSDNNDELTMKALTGDDDFYMETGGDGGNKLKYLCDAAYYNTRIYNEEIKESVKEGTCPEIPFVITSNDGIYHQIVVRSEGPGGGGPVSKLKPTGGTQYKATDTEVEKVLTCKYYQDDGKKMDLEWYENSTYKITGLSAREALLDASISRPDKYDECPGILYRNPRNGRAAEGIDFLYVTLSEHKVMGDAEEYVLCPNGDCSNFNFEYYKELRDIAKAKASQKMTAKFGEYKRVCGLLSKELLDFLYDILDFVRIIGIVLVIVLGSLDFVKATTSGDQDANKKAFKNFKGRLIAIALLFLLPVLISTVLKMVKIEGVDIDDPLCETGKPWETANQPKKVSDYDGSPCKNLTSTAQTECVKSSEYKTWLKGQTTSKNNCDQYKGTPAYDQCIK